MKTLDNLDQYIKKHRLNPSERILCEYKINVFEDLKKFIEEGKFVELYREEHPKWFKNFRAGVRIAEHYSLKLVDLIIKNFEKRKNSII